MNYRLEWFIFIGMGFCLGSLFMYRPKANLDVNRLCNRLDHCLDITSDLKEVAENITIKNATDYITDEDVEGCGKSFLLPTDIELVGLIVDTKSKQLHDILHQLALDLK